MKVFPSLLAADIGNLRAEIARAEAAGADGLHIDAMDGNVVPDISYGPSAVTQLRKMTDLHFDVHMMVADVSAYLEAYADAGANALTVHFETTSHPIRVLRRIESLVGRAGIAINPETPVSLIRHVAPFVQQVTVMSVDPGYSFQSFMGFAVDKVRELRRMAGRDLEIIVDGGVAPGGIAMRLAKAGASTFVAGGSTFGSSNMNKALAALHSPIGSST